MPGNPEIQSAQGAVFEFRVPATNDGARSAIDRVLSISGDRPVAEDDLNHVEIALMEAFNNIVEHAYAGRSDGMIEIVVELKEPGMHLTIWDDGAVMPAGRLPGGQAANPDVDPHEQEEGGYGLYLIRQLAKKLRYERVGERNRLSFRMPLRPDGGIEGNRRWA